MRTTRLGFRSEFFTKTKHLPHPIIKFQRLRKLQNKRFLVTSIKIFWYFHRIVFMSTTFISVIHAPAEQKINYHEGEFLWSMSGFGRRARWEVSVLWLMILWVENLERCLVGNLVRFFGLVSREIWRNFEVKLVKFSLANWWNWRE